MVWLQGDAGLAWAHGSPSGLRGNQQGHFSARSSSTRQRHPDLGSRSREQGGPGRAAGLGGAADRGWGTSELDLVSDPPGRLPVCRLFCSCGDPTLSVQHPGVTRSAQHLWPGWDRWGLVCALRRPVCPFDTLGSWGSLGCLRSQPPLVTPGAALPVGSCGDHSGCSAL